MASAVQIFVEGEVAPTITPPVNSRNKPPNTSVKARHFQAKIDDVIHD